MMAPQVIQEQNLKNRKEVKIVIDTETTGLSHLYDEVLSLGIVDFHTGETLFDSLIRPRNVKTWGTAQKIHGITIAHVADKPILREIIQNNADLKNILATAKIYGFNVQYDIKMLQSSLRRNGILDIFTEVEYVCLMRAYRKLMQKPKNQKLTEIANELGYQWPENEKAHGALADARATQFIIQHLNGFDPDWENKVETKTVIYSR